MNATEQVILEKLLDAQVPGFQAEFDPSEADKAGAFNEDALAEKDALEAAFDGQLSSEELKGTQRP